MVLDRLCKKDLTLGLYDRLEAENEILKIAGEKGIFMSPSYLFGSKYNRYSSKNSDGNEFKRKNGCIMCNNGDYIYYTIGNKLLNILGTNINPKINSENFNKYYNEIPDILEYKNIKFFNFSSENIKIIGDNYYIENSNKILGQWVTDVRDFYLKICNRKWSNKHRLSGYIDNPKFYIRELNEKDREQETELLNLFKETKLNTGRKKMAFENFYYHCINNNAMDKKVGLFYDDMLLAYRCYDNYGNSSYIYVENCISGIDDKYSKSIIDKYVKKINFNRLLYCIKESNEIADKILSLKKDKKWKRARNLSEHKKFKGTLEDPKNIDKKKLYLELIKENVSSDISFLKTRIKLLFLYKFIEYIYNSGIIYYNVGAGGIGSNLDDYKKRTNSYQIDCIRMIKKEI